MTATVAHTASALFGHVNATLKSDGDILLDVENRLSHASVCIDTVVSAELNGMRLYFDVHEERGKEEEGGGGGRTARLGGTIREAAAVSVQ